MPHDFFFEKKFLGWTLKGVGVCLKKPENFPKNKEMAQNWLLGVLKPAEHEFGNEKFLRCRIEGLQVDFQKNFNFVCCTWN